MSGSITINVSQYLPLQLSVPGGALGTPDSGDGASAGTLDPVTSGPPGTRLILSASGFKPGETVQPIWAFGSGSPIPQASFYEYDPQSKVSSSGAALADMWVPDTAGGTYSVALEGLTSGYIATASFTVTPSLDTGSAIAPPGSVFRLGGWGFGPKEKITVTFQGTDDRDRVHRQQGDLRRPHLHCPDVDSTGRLHHEGLWRDQWLLHQYVLHCRKHPGRRRTRT